ncbi:hypothetical protein [Streptomyces sp. C]|uniref:hypothetical protein n=1 Tax=Streptomyces sp. C TaxID=253839 RepID=UPI0001B58707|nr:hypothetical protein [Streptomyces sp. C]EFL12842.1 predicted protein [Streptomyces sp. C]
MRVSGKRIALGAAALSSALVIGIAGTASAAVGFHAVSTSGKSEIGGNYEYKYAGQADTDNPRGGGKSLYDGKFTNASATDRVGGDEVEAVLALAYDEYKNGVWSHKTNVVAVVNGTRTWTFAKKANVKAYACDRAVNTTRLLNCKAAW